MNLWIQFMVTGPYPGRVPPFGNLRIKAYLQLPEAYRSLSRPSSAISAMASTLRSYSLDLLPNLHPTLLRLLRGQMEALVLSIVRCFNSFLCSFQGAIEVLFETSKRYRNYFRFQEDIQILSDFSPAFYRSSSGFASFLKPFIFTIFSDRTDLGSRIVYSTIRVSLERR